MERTDEYLLRQYARTKSDDAFRLLALRYGSLVYSACLRYLRKPQLAEDAAQAVLLNLAEKADRIHIHTTLVPWCLTTARLICRDISRTEKRRLKHEQPLSIDLGANDVVTDIALFEALDKLRSPEREAIVLRFVQGLSLAEIGNAQGITEDAARMRVQRALARLRLQLVPSVATPPLFVTQMGGPPSPTPYLRSLLSKPYLPIMPTTLSFAAIAVAVVSLSYGWRQPVSPTTASRNSVRPGFASLLSPGPITLDALTSNRATEDAAQGPFTLTYNVTWNDVRSKEMKDKELDSVRADAKARYDADQISKDQMDNALADAKKAMAQTSHSGHLIISFDGKSLVVLDNDKEVALIQHGRKYFFAVNNPHSVSIRDEAITSYGLDELPIVGFSLPFIPITNGELVLCPVAMTSPRDTGVNRLCYVKGKISRSSNGAITQVIDGPNGKGDSFDLSDHIKFQGSWLAKSIRWTLQAFVPPDRLQPKSRIDFSLDSAKTTPLPPEAFNPGTYVADGGVLQMNFANGETKSFAYSKSQGSFDEQMSAALGGPR